MRELSRRLVTAIVVSEQHQEEAAGRVVVAENRPDDEIEAMLDAIDHGRQVRDLEARSTLRRLIEGRAQFHAQVRSDQLEHVARRLAGRHLQISRRPARHVHERVILGHDERRRRVLLEQPVVRVDRRQALGRPRLRGAEERAGQGDRVRLGHDQTRGHHPRLVEVHFAIDDDEEVARGVRRLRWTEQQVSARAQCEMKRLEDPLLRCPVEINHQVPAGDQIDVRERGILDDVVMREQHGFAELAPDAVAGAFAMEESFESLLGQVGHVGLGVDALPRRGDRVLVEIGGEHLHAWNAAPAFDGFGEQHRHRVGLFSRRAARYPDPDLVIRSLVVEEARDDALLQCLERVGVAEEMCDADQQFLHQRDRFLGLLAYELCVGAQARDAGDVHPSLDATEDRAGLVIDEVVAAAHAQQRQHVAQGIRLVNGFGALRRTAVELAQALVIVRDSGGHLRHRQHEIDHAGRDGVGRHVPVRGFARRLGDRQPAVLLHSLQARRSIRSGPGQHDADGAGAVRIGERPEEDVNRRSALLRLSNPEDVEHAVGDLEPAVGRHDVHVIGLDAHGLGHLRHRNLRRHLQDFGELAVVIGRKVKDDDVG